MKHRASALALGALLLGASACGSGHAAPSVPSKNASYAWQPIPGGPSLVCSLGYGRMLIDYGGHAYGCRLPAPTDSHGQGGVDFFGPTTTAAGPVPLGPHALRIYMNVYADHPATLRVDFGDGTHWQRSVAAKPRGEFINVVHSYAPTPHAFILVTLRDKAGYLAVEGEGPFHAPLAGPRTRYCSYVSNGKGGTLTATPSLSCAEAKRLFSRYVYPGGKIHGYRCRAYGLGPYGSDVGVESCTSGRRAFVYTSVP